MGLYDAVCQRDLEVIIAKLAGAPYGPEATTWVKIKNPGYTQAEGRIDFFDGRRSRLPFSSGVTARNSCFPQHAPQETQHRIIASTEVELHDLLARHDHRGA
jgi:hypothetical protein